MKLEVRNVPLPPPPPPEKEYVLTLSHYEAEVLRTTAGKIGGPESGARGVWSQLSDKLSASGLTVNETLLDRVGSIYFK